MSEDPGTDGDAEHDDPQPSDEPADPGPLRRVWQLLRAAGQWVADTFRGHSGAYQMRERKR